jgi:hypothetical protein
MPVHSPVQPALHDPSIVADDDATNVQLPPVQLTSQHTLSPQSNAQPPPSQLNVQLDWPVHDMSQPPLGQERVQSSPHVQLAALPVIVWQVLPCTVASLEVPSPSMKASRVGLLSSSPPVDGKRPSKPRRPHAATASSTSTIRTRRRYTSSEATRRSTARSVRVCGDAYCRSVLVHQVAHPMSSRAIHRHRACRVRSRSCSTIRRAR